MDTAPAAVLGATFDPVVAQMDRALIVNIGNFHALAFRLAQGAIEGLFEHHTGEIDSPTLADLLRGLAAGTLRNKDVFDDMGHGALIYQSEPLQLGVGEFDVVVTGPRRAMLGPSRSLPGTTSAPAQTALRPYFAVPFGDMMLSGCFGLLAAIAELLPQTADTIMSSLHGFTAGDVSPWDAF
jgi:uncharacterized protein (DUF1786 family)